jgi:hypothetical protein
MAYQPQTSPEEARPSLRPLALLLLVLAGAWLAAIVLIAVELV